jgi:hypothetical protein
MMTGSKEFLQAFPNFGLFSARISKGSFGGFVEFQSVTRVPEPKESISIRRAGLLLNALQRPSGRFPQNAGRVLSADGRERLRRGSEGPIHRGHRSGLNEIST